MIVNKDYIDGSGFIAMFESGANAIAAGVEKINDLNVFPVKDGDTGTNMLLTLQAGVTACRLSSERNLADLAKVFADHVLYGARGNSGVIIARYIYGLCSALRNCDAADCQRLAAALNQGVDEAYTAVSVPVEGTMLTVLRCAAAAAQGDDLVALFTSLLKHAEDALAETPKQLKVLADAGVVDSGGAGVCCLFRGMLAYLRGEAIASSDFVGNNTDYIDFGRFNRYSDFSLGYCTELLVQMKGDTTADEELLRRKLGVLGNSVALTVMGDKLKIHVHTNTPEDVLSLCHSFGEFLSLKIENMSVQHNGVVLRETKRNNTEVGRCAALALADGGIMQRLFEERGASVISANPTSGELISAIKSAGAGTVFVFPNKGSMLIAASGAAKLCDGIDVRVIPSTSPAQCLAALGMLDYESTDMDATEELLCEVIGNIYTVRFCRAMRSAVYEDREIASGDYMALHGNELIACGRHIMELAETVARTVMSEEEFALVNIFTGSEEIDPNRLCRFIKSCSRYTETAVIDTAADDFALLLSFEI